MAPLAQRRLGVTQVMAALVVWTMVLVVFFEYFGVQRLEKASDAKLEQLSASFEMEMASMRRAMAEQSERTAEREAKLPDALEAKHGASQLEHHAGFLQESGDGHPEHGRRDRRLALRTAVAAGSNTATSGCVTVTADTTFKMDTTTSNGCNSLRCPPCFIVTANSVTLTVESCSSALIGSSAMASAQVLEILYINTGTGTVTIQPSDGSASVGNPFYLDAYQTVTAYCYGGGSDRQYFPEQFYPFVQNFPGIRDSVAAGSNTAASSCVTVTSSTTFKMHTVTSNGCNGIRCPPCFMVTSGTATLTVQGCSDALVGNEVTAALGSGQILQIEYINAGSGTVTITPNTAGGSAVGNSYVLNAYERVTAYCYEDGSDRQHFPDQSESGGYCPEGCDATAPNNRAGTAFTTRNVADAATQTTLDTIAAITNVDSIAPSAFEEFPGIRNTVAAASNTATSDCVTVSATTTFKMHTTTTNGCNSVRCPPCFVVTSGTATLTVQGCSTALVGDATTSALGTGQILQIEYINAGSGTVTITPNTNSGSAVGNSYVLNAYERVTAYCYQGGSDRQHFPDQSESGGYCPEGCDATTPNNRAGTAFTTRNVADSATETTLDTIAAITDIDTIASRVLESFPGIRETVAAASNTDTSDCVTVSASTTFKMHTTSTNGCNSKRCPPCFVVTSGTATLTVQGCSTALVGDATTSALGSGQVMQIEYINAGSGTVTITPNTNGGATVGNSYVLNAYERVTAYCYQAGSDRQHFPDQSESGGYCPEGCDATTPNNRAGAAFTTRNVADSATETTLNTIAGITSIDTIAPRVLAADPGGDISWDAGCSSTAVDCT